MPHATRTEVRIGRLWWIPEFAGGVQYAIALASVLIAFALGLVLRALVHHYAPIGMFFVAIALASWLGGYRPGLAALVLSIVATNLLLRPDLASGTRGHVSFFEVSTTVSLCIVGTLIIALLSLVRRAMEVIRHDSARRDFLARATASLTTSLEDTTILEQLPRAAVPIFADLCAVDMIDDGGQPRRVATECVDSDAELQGRHSAMPDVLDVLGTGESKLVTAVPRASLDASRASDRDKSRPLGFSSWICVPIKRQATTFAALTFAICHSNRRYDADDLVIVSALADRLSTAVENARLYAELGGANHDLTVANRAKDEFLAMLGHELRNPLAAIVTTLEVIAMRSPNVLVRERGIIDRQTRHLTRLVDDLLDLSRITRGKIELRKKPVDLADVITKAIETTSPLLEQRRCALQVDVGHGLMVEGDSDRLAQVVSNLLNNAAKYSDASGQIRVTGKHEGSQVVLCVRDSGAGIAPELLPRIFEAFTQGPQAIDRSQGGLGLGLAIVKTVVEHHNGSVTATSAGLGRGSEFAVRLPRLSPTLAQPEVEVHALHAPRTGRVLVVDDNSDALTSLADGLSDRGFETYRASDGPSALEVARRVHPEVAVLDIGLPVMDGYELACHMRGLPDGNRIKLIALTGYGQSSDVARAREAGFSQHLVKPASIEAIEAAIDSVRSEAPPRSG